MGFFQTGFAENLGHGLCVRIYPEACYFRCLDGFFSIHFGKFYWSMMTSTLVFFTFTRVKFGKNEKQKQEIVGKSKRKKVTMLTRKIEEISLH